MNIKGSELNKNSTDNKGITLEDVHSMIDTVNALKHSILGMKLSNYTNGENNHDIRRYKRKN